MTLEAIRDAAEFALAEFYRDHIYTRPDAYLERFIEALWYMAKGRNANFFFCMRPFWSRSTTTPA